jgi:3-oxoacyl-[acyl-carrier protein] reductase
MDLGLQGRIALITGSSRGIGKATARQFAREGAYVAVTYHASAGPAEDLAADIVSGGGHAMAIPMHLEALDSIESAVNTIQSHWGRIDILVNNAFDFASRRISNAPDFDSVPPDEWQGILRTNIEGPLRLTQTVVPLMRRQRWGRIVNVSSVLAEDGLPGAAWYSTAKASLHGLTRTLSKELGPTGILVNAVMPGLTATDRLALIPRDRLERIEQNLPIRRVVQPEEVADVIVFLCSSTNAVVTGEILRVSGGRP